MEITIKTEIKKTPGGCYGQVDIDDEKIQTPTVRSEEKALHLMRQIIHREIDTRLG